MNHVHKCRLFCHAIDQSDLDVLGVSHKHSENGSWLGCSLRLSKVNMVKLTTDEPGNPTFNCSTLFLEGGDSIIIDTPYDIFEDIFCDYFNNLHESVSRSEQSEIDETDTDL